MPLDDAYQSDKQLKDLSDEIAHAITDAFIELNRNQTTGFILFLIDFNTGVLNYISDMNKEDAHKAMKAHIARDLQ